MQFHRINHLCYKIFHIHRLSYIILRWMALTARPNPKSTMNNIGRSKINLDQYRRPEIDQPNLDYDQNRSP